MIRYFPQTALSADLEGYFTAIFTMCVNHEAQNDNSCYRQLFYYLDIKIDEVPRDFIFQALLCEDI